LKTIVIITGNELRHDFFRKYIASDIGISVIKSYCEVPNKNITQKILEETNNDFRKKHLMLRKQSEVDFFGLFSDKIKDDSNPEFIPKGIVNSEEKVSEIIKLNPDLIIAFGCSIIQEPLINKFKERFVNVHLGLSPYYRGSGTNFFPFVNNQIECVGVTFMYIDNGIDTGQIIHQIRPTIYYGDTIHQIGNRLIKEMTEITRDIIHNFEILKIMNPIEFDIKKEKLYKNSDFTEASVSQMYVNFSNEIIENYIMNKETLNAKFPIIENPSLI
jgi:hypothetical protein